MAKFGWVYDDEKQEWIRGTARQEHGSDIRCISCGTEDMSPGSFDGEFWCNHCGAYNNFLD